MSQMKEIRKMLMKFVDDTKLEALPIPQKISSRFKRILTDLNIGPLTNNMWLNGEKCKVFYLGKKHVHRHKAGSI